MHNGYIGGFSKIKRRLQQHLRDQLFHYVQGNTDSEWAFALYLNQFPDPLNGRYSADEMRQALLKTIALLNQWLQEAGIREISLLNFAVSDGEVVVCSRYINSKTSEPASLFYSSGTRFEQLADDDGAYRMVKSSNKREDIIVVSSEPLTYERADWIPVPANTVMVLTSRFNVLIYPIMDEYYSATGRRTFPKLASSDDGGTQEEDRSADDNDQDGGSTVLHVWG
jgi:glutamine amidotransferase